MIGFAGLSHLGLVSSVSISSKGFQVIGYDPNETLVSDLKQSLLPVLEPGLDDLLAKSKSKISFHSNVQELAQCDVVYASLDVSTDKNNVSDLGPLTALIQKIVPVLKPDASLVILSQVPPGFTRKLAKLLKINNLYYQVETLIFGRAVERALFPERYMVGCENSQSPLPKPYSALLQAFDCPILPMRYESAELAKISINLCLISSVTVANTVSELCEEIGADWSEIAPALKLDKRIGQHSYLSPGLGIAGGNLERDMVSFVSMARENGTDAAVVEAWLSNSQYRRNWVLRTLNSEVYAKNAEAVLAVWGLAYKPDTHSVKNSPSVLLLNSLPGFPIRAYDPAVTLAEKERTHGLSQVKSALEACQGADALVLMTPWREFSQINPQDIKRALRTPTVIDPWGALNVQACSQAGLRHLRLGASC